MSDQNESQRGLPAGDDTTVLEAINAAVAELKQHARWETSQLFAQLEALLWLRDLLGLERALPPTRGWAASPDLLLVVAQRILDTKPEAIVEMGSGTSSVVMGAALRKAGLGRLWSLEHGPEHAARTRATLAAHGLAEVATVVDAPLADQLVGAEPWLWYEVPEWAMPERVDILFVDGPPGGTWPLARYPALPVFLERLAPNATIYVDDGVRQDEHDIVQRWAREHPDFRPEQIPSEKGAWVLYRGS